MLLVLLQVFSHCRGCHEFRSKKIGDMGDEGKRKKVREREEGGGNRSYEKKNENRRM